MTKRQELLVECQRHDWFHCFSDDHSVWSAGAAHLRKIRELHEALDCPHQLDDIRKAIQGQAVEKYVEVSPGEYRDPTWKYDCIASQKRSDLLTQAEIDEILAWIDLPAATV